MKTKLHFLKYALFFVVFLLTENANSQTNKWDGSTDNNWNTAANWSLNLVPTNAHDVVIDINAAIIVNTNATINKLTITSNSTVTFTSSGAGCTITIDNTGSSIDSGSSLELRGSTGSGTRSMTIAYSGSNQTMSIAGTLNVTATGDGSVYIATNGLTTVTGTLIRSGGTITSTAANLTIASGGIYQHARNGGPIPTATWNAASTCLISGITGTIPSAGLGQSFGNFTWNCTGQTGAINNLAGASGGLTTINGNFTVSSTNGQSLNLNNSTTNRTLTLGGNFNLTGGNVDLESNSGTTTIAISGNLIVSGTATLDSTTGTASTVNGTFVFSGSGTKTLNFSTPANVGYINYTVNNGVTLELLSGVSLTKSTTVAWQGTILVNSGGIINCSTQVVDGQFTGTNGNFTISSGAKMITANATGVQGSVNTTNVNPTYNSGASYEFRGAATGIFTLSTANTITGTMTINRSAGVTIDQNFTASTLAFTDGIVTTGANAITIPAAGTITGASSTKYVNGKLNKVYASASNFFFPVGKSGVYRPLSFEYTALTGTSTVSVEQIETALAGTLPASTNLNNSRTWDISQTGGSAFTYKVTLDGTGDAITGPVVMLKRESGTTTSNAVTTPDYTNTTGFTTLTGTNNFTLGSTCTVTSNAGTNQSFCDVTPVSLSANTPTYGAGAWTVSGPSSSSAQFSSTTSPTATFTPAGGNGVYTLTWTITNGNCADNTSITVDYGTVTTWTSAGGGSWDNGTPSATKAAIIEFDYTSTGDLNACSLTVTNNADVIILASDVVTLGGGLTVDTGSTFTLNSDAILVQGGTTNVNSGDITVIRETQALKRLDYVLWSSPVAGQNLGSFSPLTVSSRFYTYTTSSDTYTAIANTNDFTDGQGYLIRVPDNHPTTPTTWNGTFTGVPNSGNITIGLSAAANGYNAVGNPYPSPISISTFLSDNSSLISGNLYFWRKTNGAAGSAYVTYSGGAYDDGAHTYENIQPGQGFIVEANSAGSLAFNNLQREANNNTFYRNADDAEASRIWLHLKSNDVIVGKMAVGYKTGATNELDSAFDGTYINDSSLALNSIVNGTELAVQHRAPFTAADIVPLSFKTNTAGTYTISINEVDGLFTDVEQNIYLKDNVLNSSHDLRTAPYSFATEAGVFANRFEIVYQAPLSVENPVFENGVVVYSKNQVINVNSGVEAMASVKVYDIRGRLLTEKNNVNATTTTIPLAQVANQVLIVQITATNGQTVSRKVVH